METEIGLTDSNLDRKKVLPIINKSDQKIGYLILYLFKIKNKRIEEILAKKIPAIFPVIIRFPKVKGMSKTWYKKCRS